MNKLQLNNINQEDIFWNHIENMHWYENTRPQEDIPSSELRLKAIAYGTNYLIENFNYDEIVELHNFYIGQRLTIRAFIMQYEKDNAPSLLLTADELWDLSAHIVGMGRTFFQYVLDNPNMILELKDKCQTNFEYCFSQALLDIES